jgi:hypothetical protein
MFWLTTTLSLALVFLLLCNVSLWSCFFFNLLFLDDLLCVLQILSMYEFSWCIKTLLADQRSLKVVKSTCGYLLLLAMLFLLFCC